MIKQTYFLGGTSPEGFQSEFSELINSDGYYTIILKGGPGTGKSTLMKKIAEQLSEYTIDLYYCSSDIKSLDAVVIEEKKLIIVDGTSPHTFDPVYPGVHQEIVNLGEYWDEKKLKLHSEAIKYLTDENKRYHARVKTYVKAMASINNDIYSIGSEALRKDKLDSYTARLCRKAIGKGKSGDKGNLSFRRLSAFTTENYITREVCGDFSKYVLNDDYFAGSDRFLRSVADYLVNNGHDVIVSVCTMFHVPIYEHIVSESAGIAFMSSSFFNKYEDLSAAAVNFRRFYNKEQLSSKKHRFVFDKKASLELASEAADVLSDGLVIHDELEKYYIDAIDFEKLDKSMTKIIKKIKVM